MLSMPMNKECRTYGVRECRRVYARLDEGSRFARQWVVPASLHHLGLLGELVLFSAWMHERRERGRGRTLMLESRVSIVAD